MSWAKMRIQDLPSNSARPARYRVAICGSLALLAVSFCVAKDRPQRVNLFPRLQAGQTLAYQISYHSDKHVKTESRVIVAAPDDSAKIDVNALLRLEVLGVQAQGDRAVSHARTKFEVLNSDSHFQVPAIEPPAGQGQRTDPDATIIH